MELNSDKTLATIELSGSFDADAVESLIRQLARLRADMTPAVPMNFPRLGELIPPGMKLMAEDDPSITMHQAGDGRFRLFIRSAGLGWLAYVLPRQRAEVIGVYLAAHFPVADQNDANDVGPEIGGARH